MIASGTRYCIKALQQDLKAAIDRLDTHIAEQAEPEYTPVNFGEIISLEFAEITIEGAGFGDKVKPENPSNVYRYLSDKEGEQFIYVYGTIKNISGNQYEIASNMFAKMTFDDKYN